MVKKKYLKLSNLLQRLMQERNINVHQIVIFGSHARSDSTPTSDIDIVIVSKDFENKDIFERLELIKGIHQKLVEEVNMPFDILYYSVAEWEEDRSPLLKSVKTEGIRLI